MALSLSDLNTLGISTKTPPRRQPSPEETARAVPSWSTLEPGSTVSRALFEVVSGRRVTIIDSPPGAGKSTATASMALWLADRTDMRVTIAAPTRNAATAIAEKIAEAEKSASVVLALSGLNEHRNTSIYTPGSGAFQGGSGDIVVRTMASLGMDASTETDLLIVDEAYQATYASMIAAGKASQQVLMVGDPGQIGPVVTSDTSLFADSEYAPNLRAPDVLRQHPSAKVLHLPRTYRLGARTVRAIAPLYDFPFDSGRPPRRVDGRDEIEGVVVDEADPIELYRKVAEVATDLVGQTLITDDHQRPLEETDVCVVAGDNMGVNGIAGFLSLTGHYPGITVGTADRLQGGQWHAVVAVDPLASASTVSDHHLAPGRLCVMASRHMTHMTWVHDGHWEESIAGQEDVENPDLLLAVRRDLTS